MSNRTYRLITLHQSINRAIESEIDKGLLPYSLRLMRLRVSELAIKERLKMLATPAARLA